VIWKLFPPFTKCSVKMFRNVVIKLWLTQVSLAGPYMWGGGGGGAGEPPPPPLDNILLTNFTYNLVNMDLTDMTLDVLTFGYLFQQLIIKLIGSIN
jgi:hypothetical protein